MFVCVCVCIEGGTAIEARAVYYHEVNHDIHACTGSRVSLSLRGVTIYNDSYINNGDIGGTADEGLQCHTNSINCCDSEYTENGSALGDWYYPSGSRVLSLDEIGDSDNRSYVSRVGVFVNRSQSVIRLFGSTESGHYCCKIPDQFGFNQILCVNLGKNVYLLLQISLFLTYQILSFC